MQGWVVVLFGALGDVNRVIKLKGKERLGGKNDLLIAGEGCACCACSAASERANGCALAAACQSTNERAEAGAATDESSGAFALAFFCSRDGRGGYGIAAPAGVNGRVTYPTGIPIGPGRVLLK